MLNKKKSFLIASAIAFLAVLAACQKMDDTYRQFVVPDGLVYVGKADPIFLNSGQRRVKISWLRGTDQKAVMARIYWNNKADSIDVPINVTNARDTVSVIINNLEEGSYTFNIYTRDANNNTSIRVDAQTSSYDSTYTKSLLNRVITGIKKSVDTAVVTMVPASITVIGTRFSYINKQGGRTDTLVTGDVLDAKLLNMNKDTVFSYITLYKPDTTCLDLFYSPLKNYPR
ncbi:DUF4998 domain-containing protein [Niabella pedocola]|uniref:DUF4998 domain-containing protein n=1 Tax=Niabella pedocola TaxID=1752077 RepID=A0ABS8PUT5_9BACT|nr:DUF4998 domain-containing protein [Niabella pedocola]MCD2424675.1 DUF4998 domain-containing protein [Niabella pedocola]